MKRVDYNYEFWLWIVHLAIVWTKWVFKAYRSLRSKRFCRVFRPFEAFFAFWRRKNWGERNTAIFAVQEAKNASNLRKALRKRLLRRLGLSLLSATLETRYGTVYGITENRMRYFWARKIEQCLGIIVLCRCFVKRGLVLVSRNSLLNLFCERFISQFFSVKHALLPAWNTNKST